MQTLTVYFQIILSILVIILILVQPKGKGLGSSFGGGSTISFTRRGLERWIFKLTFFISILFIITSIIELIY